MTDLTGKTIERVTTRELAARDTFQEWRGWTETTLHFTDGTTVSYAIDSTEVYEPIRELLECETCGLPVVESADTPGEYVHPFEGGLTDDDHEARPAATPTCRYCGGTFEPDGKPQMCREAPVSVLYHAA